MIEVGTPEARAANSSINSSGIATFSPTVKERRFNFWALYAVACGGNELVNPFIFPFLLFDPAVVLL
jgi:hypothetical protein